jgi:hypothetical protein
MAYHEINQNPHSIFDIKRVIIPARCMILHCIKPTTQCVYDLSFTRWCALFASLTLAIFFGGGQNALRVCCRRAPYDDYDGYGHAPPDSEHALT